MKNRFLIFLLSLTLAGLSGCATYEAITGKDSTLAASKVDAITEAATADLNSLGPIISAVHPLGGVGVELATGAIAVIAALFGSKQRRTRIRTEAALKTVMVAVDKAKAQNVKSIVAVKSAGNGTAQTINTVLDSLPGA